MGLSSIGLHRAHFYLQMIIGHVLIAYSLYGKMKFLPSKTLYFKQKQDILGNHLFCFQKDHLGCQNVFRKLFWISHSLSYKLCV